MNFDQEPNADEAKNDQNGADDGKNRHRPHHLVRQHCHGPAVSCVARLRGIGHSRNDSKHGWDSRETHGLFQVYLSSLASSSGFCGA